MTQPLDFCTVALKMFGSLSFVLLILFVVFYGIKRFSHRNLTVFKEKMIQVLATHYLGSKKSIMIMKVPGKILVVGITNDSIRLLTRLNNEDFFRVSSKENDGSTEDSFLNMVNISSKKIVNDDFQEK